ncbi:MAG: ubiquinol-cytochrome C chaperone family protein [Hyphomicrobium sp.]|uniref:ubiquinol-cytochrome C chaperone family protein n=1 Tax=Hyphomicrobium sp. TaxID=82 RepID=UPI0039E467AB
MLRWLKKQTEIGRRAEELYGSVVAAARQPAFYGAIGVPDTPEGRFELIVLHLFLALQGSLGSPAEAEILRQRTIEVFVTDMDDCMREMGVGDLAVPKKVKRAAAAFYERATVYQRLIAGEADEHSIALYIFPGASDREDASRLLAHYVRRASAALDVEPFDHWVECGASRKLLDETIAMTGKVQT